MCLKQIKAILRKFDRKLAFDDHVSDICKRTGTQQLQVHNRYIIELHNNGHCKETHTDECFFTSLCSYCPLAWMYHGCANKNKISKLHERCIRIIYNDKQSSFTELLEIDSSVSVHIRNIQILATEMQKLINNLSPSIKNRVSLNSDTPYSLTKISKFSKSQVRLVYYGMESISNFGPKMWNILPDDYKTIENLDTFKIKMKTWKPEN